MFAISCITNKYTIIFTVPECSFPKALIAYVTEKSVRCIFGNFSPLFYNMHWTRKLPTWGNRL